MKKSLLLILITFGFMGLLFSDINVTNPTAGQTVCKGSTLTITWTSSGCPTPNVKIRLRQGAVKILDIHDSTLDDGTFGWPVPGSLANGSYFIRVASTDGTMIGDSPNFTITNCGPITVTQPIAGQEVCKNNTLTIEWTSSSLPTPNVKIRLRQGGVKILDIHDSTLDDGTYNWPVPGSLASGSYFIRVASTDGTVIGDSPNFTISACGDGPGPGGRIDWGRLKDILRGLQEIEWWRRWKGPKPPWPCLSCPPEFNMHRIRELLEKAGIKERVTVELFHKGRKVFGLGSYGPKVLSKGRVLFSSMPKSRGFTGKISKSMGEKLGSGKGFTLIIKNAKGKIMGQTSIMLKEKMRQGLR